MKTIIHVNQHIIKSNNKCKEKKPVITCKTYKSNDYAKEVELLDTNRNVVAKVIYSPDNPLSCGAKVWIETLNEINIVK